MNNRPRILMVGPDPNAKGGIATVVKQYQRHLPKDYFHWEYVSTTADRKFLMKVFLYSFSLARLIWRLPHYDIVHIHMASRGSYMRKRIVVRLGKLFGKKVVIHLHGAEFQKFYVEESSLRQQKKIRETLRMANRLIVLSKEWSNFFGTIAEKDKIMVLRNSVPIQEQVVDYNSFDVIFLGEIGKRKGIYDILNVLPEIIDHFPDIRLHFAGNGEIEQCRQKCKELQVDENVEFLGWVDEEKKRELLLKNSIFLLPSYHEGLPMSMLEAMSYGCAVIVSQVGGIPSVIRHMENGILICPGKAEELREALEVLLKNHDLRRNLGQQAQQTISEMYNMEKHMEQLKTLYFTICS